MKLLLVTLLVGQSAFALTATVEVTHPDGEVKTYRVERTEKRFNPIAMGKSKSSCDLSFEDAEFKSKPDETTKFIKVTLACRESLAQSGYLNNGACGVQPASLTIIEIGKGKSPPKVWAVTAKCD